MDSDTIDELNADGASDYTDEEIDRLIGCKKKVVEPPQKQMRNLRGYLRNEMTVESLEEGNHFHVFMRQNITFKENFSIGLVFLPNDGRPRIRLIRFNGQHVHRELESDFKSSCWHESSHVHKAKVQNISAGLKEDRFAVRTGRYASFQEAQAEFFKEINLTDVHDYFPTLSQLSFSFGKEAQ